MKKPICLLLSALILVFSVFPVFARAGDTVSEEITVKTFEDGSVLKTTLSLRPDNESTPSALSRLLSFLRQLIRLLLGLKNNAKTVSGEKYLSYYDANGVKLWTEVLKASFSCTTGYAECTKAETEFISFDADWKEVSCTCTTSGHTAEAAFSVRQTKLGVPFKLIKETLVLSCDTDGKLY